MLVPVKWLSEYVDISGIDLKTLEDKLIMSGSNTETVERILGKSENLKMGKIISVEKHPEADKLFIIMVDMGSETLQIVTGASNCIVGKLVCVAVHGSCISDGTKIKKGKLRNVESNGMLCSLDEMGFEDKVVPKEFADGIFLLNGTYELGLDIKESFTEFDDAVIDFEITPNRPDCLSIIGMAREAAATFDRKLSLPEIQSVGTKGSAAEEIAIEIKDPDICKRYVGKVVKNVKITDSPDWLKLKLMKAGMRPINNIVDVTNFVMLEMGQPLHAFDLDTIKSKKIIVRRAHENEILTTLDSVDRKLSSDMLVIADGERAVALAGIMGGEDTEITGNTVNLLIESANFDKSNIRKSSKDIGLRSEASSRFEKGVSETLCLDAANRACQLIEMIGAGEVICGSVDVYPSPSLERVISARIEKINDLIGLDLTAAQMMVIFDKLGLESVLGTDTTSSDTMGTVHVTIPGYRLDLLKEIDLVEEVARIYGYDNIPVTMPKGSMWGAKTNGQHIEDVARGLLIGDGYFETLTYSFVSPRALDQIRIPEYSLLKKQVRIINPLGEEYSAMRTSLIPNAMEILSRNYKQKVENARIFEIGNVFIPKEDIKELPYEKKNLVLASYGSKEDFFTLKGSVEKLFEKLGIKDVLYIKEGAHPTFNPGRCATIAVGNHIIGTIGEIHPKVLENYDIETRAYVADLDFNMMLQMTRLDRLFKHLPKYPAITRDLAFLVKDEVEHANLEMIIRENAGKKLEEIKLFDVYKGKQIEEGYKSMAYALVYRDNEKTLTDEEINGYIEKLLKALEAFGAKLR